MSLIQNAVQTFLKELSTLPSGPEGHSRLDNILTPALQAEEQLRTLFAVRSKDQLDPQILSDPFIGLVDLFAIDPSTLLTRERNVQGSNFDAHFIFPLDGKHRRHDGVPSTVDTLQQFYQNWHMFSFGSLSKLTNWSNIIVAGGSVLACLSPGFPVPKGKDLMDVYQSDTYRISDIDVFLWGLSAEQVSAH